MREVHASSVACYSTDAAGNFLRNQGMTASQGQAHWQGIFSALHAGPGPQAAEAAGQTRLSTRDEAEQCRHGRASRAEDLQMQRQGPDAHLPELGCFGVVLLPLTSGKAVYLGLQALGTLLLLLDGALDSFQLLLHHRRPKLTAVYSA